MKLLIKPLLVLVCLLASSYIQPEDIDYQEDLQILRKALLEHHPSLYRFTSPKLFEATFDSITQAVSTQNHSQLDFFRAVSQLFSMIREGHSSVSPSDKIQTFTEARKLLPFQVQFIDSQLFITNSYVPSYNYLKHHRILSINGKSINELLSIFRQRGCARAGNHYSYFLQAMSEENNFALSYFYYIDTAERFKIVVQNPEDNQKQTLNIIGKEVFRNIDEEPTEPFRFQIDRDKKIGILTIQSFAYWMHKLKPKDYYRFFKRSFKQLADEKIQSLIIDVRGNRGGEELIAAELLRYFATQPFTIYRSVTCKTLDFHYTNSLPNSNKTSLNKHHYRKEGARFYLNKAPFLKELQPVSNYAFNGDVFILSNGRSASATNTFLALVKTLKCATIIGQESGGLCEAVDGRMFISFTLPNSKLNIRFPVWALEINATCIIAGRGIIPDYTLSPTLQNKNGQTDDAMDYTYRLIQNNKPD